MTASTAEKKCHHGYHDGDRGDRRIGGQGGGKHAEWERGAADHDAGRDAALAGTRLLDECGYASTLRSRRSFATCPVARTLYCATATRPSGSTTTVDRIKPS